MSNPENKLTLKVLNKAKTNDIKSIFILQNGCEKNKYHKILLKEFNAKWKYLKTYGNIWWIPTSFSVNEVEQRVNELNNGIDMFVKRQNKVVRRSKKNEDLNNEDDDDEDNEDNEDDNDADNEETVIENTIENVQKQDFKKKVPESLVTSVEDKKKVSKLLVTSVEDKKKVPESLVIPIEDKKQEPESLVTNNKDKKKISKNVIKHIKDTKKGNESLIPNTESLVEKETKTDNKKKEEMMFQFNKNNTEQIKKYVKKYTEELEKNIKRQLKEQMKDEMYKINKEIENINKEINKIKNKKIEVVQEEKKGPRLSDEILKFYRQYAVGTVKKDGKSNDNLYPTESDSDLSSDTDDSLVPRTPSPYKENDSDSEKEIESESD